MDTQTSNALRVLTILFFLMLIVAFTTGCAIPEHMQRQCGGDLKVACQKIFGENNDERQDAEIDQLEKEQLELKQNLAALEQIFASAAASTNASDAQIVASFQFQINQLAMRTAYLETHQPITQLIDPCGDQPGIYDEVIMRLSDGRYVAYFENGGARRLSVLVPGSYSTTDGGACVFTVQPNGTLTW